MSDLAQTLGKPITSGLSGAILSYVLFDGAGRVIVSGKEIPGWLLVGVVVAGSTFVGEIGKGYLLPYLQGMKWGGFEGSIAEPALTGLSTYLLLMFMDKADYGNFIPSFLLGAGSNIVGNYAFDNCIHNWIETLN